MLRGLRSAATSAARSLEVGVGGTQPLTCPQHPDFRGSPHTHLDYLPPGPVWLTCWPRLRASSWGPNAASARVFSGPKCHVTRAMAHTCLLTALPPQSPPMLLPQPHPTCRGCICARHSCPQLLPRACLAGPHLALEMRPDPALQALMV